MTHQVAQRDRLARLSAAGVSIWLDDLGRQRLRDGSRCLGLFPLHGSPLVTLWWVGPGPYGYGFS